MKKFLSVLFLLVFIMGLTACGKAPAEEKPVPEISEAPVEVKPEETPEQLTYTVYLPNDNADGFDVISVSTEEISPEAVLAELKNRNVLPEGVSINNFSQDGAMLKLDFNQAFADIVCSMGTSGEFMIVGSVVNSFLDAFHAETLSFTVNGRILESGHTIYDFPLQSFSY